MILNYILIQISQVNSIFNELMNDKKKLTPREIEDAKTHAQKAEDISYTFNHSIVCTATDFIDPYIGNVIQKKLGNKSQLPNTYIAEFIGDFGAVPFTIATQRLFPGLMHNLQKISEPVFKGMFLKGAEHYAKDWAKKNNYSIDSNEYKEKVQKIYSYETSHLPQAIVWTISATGLNVAAQKLLGNKAPIPHILAGKIGGSILTAAITLGGRSIAPRKAEKFDRFTSEKILVPIENKIHDIFGFGDKDHDEKHKKKWSDRIETDKNSVQTAISI
jgi:hypothetical protein